LRCLLRQPLQIFQLSSQRANSFIQLSNLTAPVRICNRRKDDGG
jgi:hypothetical protein